MANKQIKDFDLKESIDGLEDLLIQDSNGITKRIKTSKLMGNLDLSNYYTKAEVDDLLANTDLSIDMADYYDKATIDNLLAKKANVSHAHSYNDLTDKPSIPSINGLATKKELTDGLATKSDATHNHDKVYALKTDIPTVPTKTSQLTNDSGFIKSIPSEYITETELSAKSYATETYVQNKIAEAALSGGEVDLSGLATKDELNSSLATKSDTTHNHDTVYAPIEHEHSQYLTSVPSEYVTDEELNEKGYLTEHQDISGKADKLYVDTELAKKSDKTHTHSYNNLTDKPTIPSTANLATKTELTNGLATKANKSEIPSLEGYATETFVTNKIAEASLSGGEVDLSGLATKAELATKADKTAIPTKTSQLTNDSGFLTEHQNISSKADKTYVDKQLATKSNTDHTHSYNDLADKPTIPSTTNLATKKELTDGLATKSDKVHTHDQYLTEHQDISMKADKSELHSHANKTVLDSITSSKVTEWNNKSNFDGNYNSLTNKPTIPTVPTNVSSFTNDAGYLTSIPSEYVTETELNDAISGLGGGTGNVSSDVIRSIMVVDALPEVELEGVLYLVKETTVTNLYPSQTKSTISKNDITITFTGRNVTIDGGNDIGSVKGQTEQFDMNLEANKTYYLQFTNVSGSFDDSKRVSQFDGMICGVEFESYDSSDAPIMLIDQVERDASGIYNKFTFTPKVDCIKFRLRIQAKKLVTFSNWTCSIVIAEEKGV